MDRKTEKKIEAKLGKKVSREIKKEVEKEVGREVKERVEREVEKRLHYIIYKKTRESAAKFKKEFQNQVVVAIGAALGFLIALSWRTPIQESVDKLTEYMGLVGKAVYVQFLSALVITLIAVLILMVVSKWKSGSE